MIFRRIHVDGFGIWQDLDLDKLGPGLNVLLAPNEGGKSTLMAFIRAVLFGFKRRGDARRYEPLRGGTHGGRLDVTTDGVDYRIRREDDGTSRGEVTVEGADGRRFPDGKLDSLIRNTTETLYENVFAFGLDELQRLDTLQAEDVAGHIYSAGMGSGALSPVAFRQRMQDVLESLHRARGKKQPIARLLAEIEADCDAIEQHRQLPSDHNRLLRQRDKLRARLGDYDQSLQRKQSEYDNLRRAQRAWLHYERILEAEATLETIGIDSEEVRTAAARATRQRIDAHGGSDSDSGVSVQATTTTREYIDPATIMSRAQQGLLRQATRIRGLLASAERLRDLHGRLLDQQQAARASRHEVFSDLEGYGGDWSLDRVRAVPTDVEARDKVRQWRERLHAAEADITATEARAADANMVYEALRESREQINRGTLIVAWVLIALAIAATSVLVPGRARLVSAASVVSVGLLLGSLITWLHSRGLGQRRAEQAVAAEREAERWQFHEDAKIALERTAAEWREWITGLRLPATLSPQGALDLLERLRETQQKDQATKEAEAAVASTNAELQAACMEVLSVLEDLDRQAFDLRYDTLKMVDPLLSTIGALQAELDDVETHRDRIRRVLDDHSQARAGLQALAGADGVDTFRRGLERWDPESLARATGEAHGKLASVRADRDALNESLGALRQQIRDVERDEGLSNLLLARESRRAELTEHLQEWAAHALTAALYDEAKRTYEAERQPEVLRLASRYFRMMTDDQYDAVIAPLGENRLEVQRTHGGERLEPAALSRGTGEQLYLAMRLALAKVYGDRAVPLPLVADDILVNFDDDRARATARLLDVFASEGHQILAFTCHRHLVETFDRHAPGATIQRLPAHA